MQFGTTRWSLIRRATGDDAAGRTALDELCARYWPAVYAFFRSTGDDPERAADHTQGLFARLLERGDLATADPARGRFRSWLKTCARHHQSHQLEAERALKRGGAERIRSLDAPTRDDAEARFQLAAPHADEPDRAFDRAWAQALIDRALQQLRSEQIARGRGARCDALLPWLDDSGQAPPQRELAAELGLSEGALRVALHRLRGRFRDLLLREVRDTLEQPQDAGDELGELLRALATTP